MLFYHSSKYTSCHDQGTTTKQGHHDPPPPDPPPFRIFCSAPLLVYSIDDALSRFNERRNWCEVYDPVDTAMYILGCVPIAGAFVLVYQMRKVRKQMNEYRLQVFQLTFVLVTGTIVFPLQHLFLDNRHEIRRIWTLWHNVFVSLFQESP